MNFNAQYLTGQSYPFDEDSHEYRRVNEARHQLIVLAGDLGSSLLDVSIAKQKLDLALQALHQAQAHYIASHPLDDLAKRDQIKYRMQTVSEISKARIGEQMLYDPRMMVHATDSDLVCGRLLYYMGMYGFNGDDTVERVYLAEHTVGTDNCWIVIRDSQGQLYPMTVDPYQELYIYLPNM